MFTVFTHDPLPPHRFYKELWQIDCISEPTELVAFWHQTNEVLHNEAICIHRVTLIGPGPETGTSHNVRVCELVNSNEFIMATDTVHLIWITFKY